MRRLSRRSFIRTAALGAGASLALSTLPASVYAQALEQLPYTVIGFSQGGDPLVIHHLGNGLRRVFIMGGQHGGPEFNSTQLARRILEHFAAYPYELPPGLGLDVMPLGNPDGTNAGIRQYLSGVDPNRNWDGAGWSADAYDSNGLFRVGLGGPEPFSEQETRAVRDWLIFNRPALMINYHSQGGFMFGSGDLATAYADASEYYWSGRPREPGSSQPSSGGSLLGYRASGTTNGWLRSRGIPSVFVELSTSTAVEFERNLAGVNAVLAHLANFPVDDL